MVTAESVFPKTGNDPIYASEINGFNYPICEVYTGSSFNIGFTGTGDVSGGYAFALLTPSSLKNGSYLHVDLLLDKYILSNSTTERTFPYITIQTRTSGGVYSDSFPQAQILRYTSATSSTDFKTLGNISWVHPLTAAERASGCQVQIIARIEIQNDGGGSTGHAGSIINKGSFLRKA